MFDRSEGRFDGQDNLSTGQGHSSQGPPPQYESSTQSRPTTDSKQTAPPPTNQESSSRIQFASVSFHQGDRIRIMQLSVEICDAIRIAIQDTWPRGIQQERGYHGSWEFKMRGYPWLSSGDEAIHARRLTRGILSILHSFGYVLYISTDVSASSGDIANLFFRHQDPAPAPCEWFSCMFTKGDQLRLIDAPQDVVNDIVGTLRTYTQSHEPYRVSGVYGIKFSGSPFAASGGDIMVSRAMVMQLFEALERNGFTMFALIDQKYGGSNGLETDTWHISRPLDWVPGAPVYHQ